MIPVKRQPEPATFDAEVRQPGNTFLARVPNPSTKQYQSHSYWRKAIGDLRASYNNICAYTCHWISHDTGSTTVEHYVPKIIDPSQAYEWSNYRLVCGRLNGRKGSHQDVLDPFRIGNNWFILDFPSLLVKPSKDLSADQQTECWMTIKRLRLNHDETCVAARLKYVENYCEKHISLAFLEKEAPFIYQEITRQGITESIRDIMGIWNEADVGKTT